MTGVQTCALPIYPQGHLTYTEDSLVDFAEKAGVPDLERFRADMTDAATAKAVTDANRHAYSLGIKGTPFSIVNDAYIGGYRSADYVRATVLEQAAIEIDKSLEDKKFFNDVNEIVQNQKLNEKYIIFKDKYYIVKKDTEEFGSFILLENAITLRNLLMENKWDTEKIPDDYLTDYSLASHDRIFYIRKYRDKYVLSKVINNELEYFGTYDTKEEAVAQRTYLINHNWQMIQENNEKIDEHVYAVDRKSVV